MVEMSQKEERAVIPGVLLHDVGKGRERER